MLWIKRYFFESVEVYYVGLDGETTTIGDLSELSYEVIYKVCNTLTKLENNGE